MKKLVMLVLTAVVIITLAACSGGTEVAASTIAIDVNPSIVLELDEDDKVINVVLNNEDAEIIVGDMDLIGVDYEVAVNALIGSMVANGYINELANSVLLSIQSDDEVHEADLKDQIGQAVSDYLAGSSIDGSVITQTLDFDDEAEALAETLGISEAKAELILDIIELDPRMTVEELAALSINDLNLLLESKEYELEDVSKSGEASDLALITVDEAYQVALTETGVVEADIIELDIELEQEDGIMVFEVEIETETEEFEVLVNAKDGTVYVDMDDEDDDDEEYVFPTDALTEEALMELIVTEFELDPAMITELEIEQEMENGVAYYEVDFDYENTEYEVEVDAVTGEFFEYSMELDDDYEDSSDVEEDSTDTEEDSTDTEEDSTDTEE